MTATKELPKENLVLREYREMMKLSQSDFGKLVGVTQRCISAYETGHRKPSLKVAIKIAKLCKCNVADIFEF